MKSTSVFLCSACGNDFPRWAGQCPTCSEWNTLKEYTPPAGVTVSQGLKSPAVLQNFSSIAEEKERIQTGIEEFDRVLGGGMVSDAFILLTGDPGIGKSTLALQVALKISKNKKLLYVSGEESSSQIVSRAKRLCKDIDSLQFALLTEQSLETVFTKSDEFAPEVLVIDSIQTLMSESVSQASGSFMQVRVCAERIMQYVKTKGIACILIGHVTKEGEFSGPQTLAHLVDAVLYLEGDKYHQFRMLRSQKNRFGSVSEMGVFTMDQEGLQEVKNPSEAFLEGRLMQAEGSAIIPIVEGTRPFLIELQALCSWTSFGYPKRTASGIDNNRLSLMLAVLQKHGGTKMDSIDVFINIIGGMKVEDQASDLGLLMAIASSKQKVPLPEKAIFLGEVGLSGEIRAVTHIERRLKEAEKLGFTMAYIPKLKKMPQTSLELKPLLSVAEALRILHTNTEHAKE